MIGWLIVGALAWLALACPLAVLIGRALREADRRAELARGAEAARRAETEADLLSDQPVDVLTPAGINARFRQIAPSPSTRSWSA